TAGRTRGRPTTGCASTRSRRSTPRSSPPARPSSWTRATPACRRPPAARASPRPWPATCTCRSGPGPGAPPTPTSTPAAARCAARARRTTPSPRRPGPSCGRVTRPAAPPSSRCSRRPASNARSARLAVEQAEVAGVAVGVDLAAQHGPLDGTALLVGVRAVGEGAQRHEGAQLHEVALDLLRQGVPQAELAHAGRVHHPAAEVEADQLRRGGGVLAFLVDVADLADAQAEARLDGVQ